MTKLLPPLLVQCLAILAAVLSILAVHVEPAQGLRTPSAPPSPHPCDQTQPIHCFPS
ncbi:hypothetical protein BS78_08G053000 [Paspalum vaginatum]|nr:hypothetical protein BS78_08G053000 [Paspalum vaginatum]